MFAEALENFSPPAGLAAWLACAAFALWFFLLVDKAIAMPRIHHNLFPDVVHVEPSGLDAATAHALEARGHQLDFAVESLEDPKEHSMFAFPWGKACGVQVDRDHGWRMVACDPRNSGGGAVP